MTPTEERLRKALAHDLQLVLDVKRHYQGSEALARMKQETSFHFTAEETEVIIEALSQHPAATVETDEAKRTTKSLGHGA